MDLETGKYMVSVTDTEGDFGDAFFSKESDAREFASWWESREEGWVAVFHMLIRPEEQSVSVSGT